MCVIIGSTNDIGGSRESMAIGNIGVDRTPDSNATQLARIQPCNKKACRLCEDFDDSEHFYSTITRRRYKVQGKKGHSVVFFCDGCDILTP